MTTRARPGGGVHLIGSVPLADSETVFRTVAGVLGPFLRRIPDGVEPCYTPWPTAARFLGSRAPATRPAQGGLTS